MSTVEKQGMDFKEELSGKSKQLNNLGSLDCVDWRENSWANSEDAQCCEDWIEDRGTA